MGDYINAIFEFSGAFFIYLSIRRLYQQKLVRGVHWGTTAFFSVWGLWNLYYYPSLDQWASFAGGVAICATNAIYLSMIFYYVWKERQDERVDLIGIDAPIRASEIHWGMGEAPKSIFLGTPSPGCSFTAPAGRLRQRRSSSL